MSDDAWRPLGVETVEEVAEYDALHDGVPAWMSAAFWAWIQEAITQIQRVRNGYGDVFAVSMLAVELVEEMCQRLRIPLPNVREEQVDQMLGQQQIAKAMSVLRAHPSPLQVADYLLAHGRGGQSELDEMLTRSKSAWEVGTRAGRPGLVRRVPIGVQLAADSVMSMSGRAGVRLAKAWEELYGLEPNASAAYGFAIKAVEDAAVPVVSPTNANATLGTVLRQMEDQKNWQLPMNREHDKAPSRDVLVGMLRLLWHGQHDRHGGQPSAPGDVSIEEATVAVSMAVTLVNWFESGLVARAQG
ncbi:hypothetical protein [Terrabacter terrigena]|uniref:Abortive infection protein-like C-terminal domain-containing protein n=1 Tax=Terrabacter terrigena TaxID=574718 RepID=A0ABW3MZ27_9MICO